MLLLILALVASLAIPVPAATAASTRRLTYTGDDGIYVISVGGGEPTRITTVTDDAAPAWSPDGMRIAFVRADDAGATDIYTVAPDGSDVLQVTATPESEAHPGWSPDSSRIVFSRRGAEDAEIYSMNAGGSDEVQLTDNSGDDLDPSWSPDGTRIAYASTEGVRSGCEDGEPDVQCPIGPEIFSMATNGSDVQRLTFDRSCCQASDLAPAWNNDSSRIAFHKEPEPEGRGFPSVYTMNSNGTQSGDLFMGFAGQADANWQPDGDMFALTTFKKDELPQISITTRDGQCTRELAAGTDPSWEGGEAGGFEQWCPQTSIQYDDGAFMGAVDPDGGHFGRNRSTHVDGCSSGRRVVIYEKTSGDDVVVAETTTGEDGTFEVRTTADGRFYATVDAKSFVASDGTSVICIEDETPVVLAPSLQENPRRPPPVYLESGRTKQDAAWGTHSWCHSQGSKWGTCYIADAFRTAYPSKPKPARAGARATITFERSNRPQVSMHYWRKEEKSKDPWEGGPKGKAKRLRFELRKVQGEERAFWVAYMKLPTRAGPFILSLGVEWDGPPSSGNGGGQLGFNLKLR